MKFIVPCLMLLIPFIAVSQKAVRDTSAAPLSTIDPPMIFVKGGNFTMGSDSGIAKERPAHTVTIHSFIIAKYEVSQNFWKVVMNDSISHCNGCSYCPVENVSWREIQTFLKRLNAMTGRHYRLPTEAEWEYAAAGGVKSKGYKYSGSDDPEEVGWIKSNADGKTHPVGKKKPNELGIYDMCGNVWEICSDWYHKNYYKKSPAKDPVDKGFGFYHVVRGGSWRSGPERCYNKARNRNIRDHHIHNGGFRIVLDR